MTTLITILAFINTLYTHFTIIGVVVTTIENVYLFYLNKGLEKLHEPKSTVKLKKKKKAKTEKKKRKD